jgi:hypothetical protein
MVSGPSEEISAGSDIPREFLGGIKHCGTTFKFNIFVNFKAKLQKKVRI